ncbi:hypothetical protein ACIQNU_38460 [Streptomyces sp. NPDC091292]|uniref:hypothetical protein n=1 Tax=Streptomyces sp. NPDC091292 TaxID=3365991 RepID=UPI00380F75FB
MAETVPVRCPDCRREHAYAATALPCPCGAPIVPPLVPGAPPLRVTHRIWADDWVTVRCRACGREDQWPSPELGCSCGTLLRIPVRETADPEPAGVPPHVPPHVPPPALAPVPRPAFQPVAVRTARDAVIVAALYLRWLGWREIRQADSPPPSGVALTAPGVIALVAPTVLPVSPRDVECLWLTATTEGATCMCFSLAGYEEDARTRADTLSIPLFTIDLTGTPQPLNTPADELNSTGA